MTDKDLITSLGGPTKVAELLGLDKASGGVQRVQNWMTRGIPPKVKLSRPDLFLRELSLKKPRINPEPTLTPIEEAERKRNGGIRTHGDAKDRNNISK